jgi:preprotein translocase subunit SecD
VNNKRLWASIIIFVGTVAGLLSYSIASGNTPVLGLDLQGGLSVIYATEEPAADDQLIIVRDLMRDQLESFGIAEPDVRVEGENIIVDLPGVEDQESAFDALQVSGIVTLRPVMTCGTGLTPDETQGLDVLPVLGESTECLVGPSGGTGEVFEQGSAGADISQQTGQWIVTVDLRGDGEIVWNALAQQCFNGTETCPSRQLAIVLDDVIQSAPTVQTPDFPGTVQISGAFSEDEVRSLARVLNRGAFPVPVVQERVETVSPTAGHDALAAAWISGLIGAALMLLFMIFYYRKLAVVIIAGLLVWGMTVFMLASLVSQATNYALTLAGVTGIIVAVGITVDTYVVFFERLREEVRHGRSIRNAAPRSFQATWRTILSGDVVSLMASLILFWLSVGSVKGFALYLGLTTICDLLVCYFFTRPAVFLFSQTRWLEGDRVGATGTATTPIGATS